MSTETTSQEPAVAAKGKVAKATTQGIIKQKHAHSKIARSMVVSQVRIDQKAAAKARQAEIPDGLSKQYFGKSTFNTSDIMHSPVEKTIQMLTKILDGEKLFTM